MSENGRRHKSSNTSEKIIIDFFDAHPWQWERVTENDIESMTYGYLHIQDGVIPLCVEDYKLCVEKEISAIVGYCATYGYKCKVSMQLGQFECCLRSLLVDYDFETDGSVSFAGSSPAALNTKINTLFSSILVLGKRVVDLMDHYFKKRGGVSGIEDWNRIRRSCYDNSVVYAFCYDYRNCLEHESSLISIVNVDMSNSLAGFAINVDAGILESRLKAKTKERLAEFAAERRRENLSPWLSVGQCAKQYGQFIRLLYYMFLGTIYDELSINNDNYQDFLSHVPKRANCIIEVKKPFGQCGYVPGRVVYRFVEPDCVLKIASEIETLSAAFPKGPSC